MSFFLFLPFFSLSYSTLPQCCRYCLSSLLLRHATRQQTFLRGTQVFAAGFDHLGLAMLHVFQATTLSGWSYLMYRAMDGTSPAAALYFVVLAILGGQILVRCLWLCVGCMHVRTRVRAYV